MRVHHEKHHAAYVDKTNDLAEKADLDGRCLRDIVTRAAARGARVLYNNAAQAWNHEFFWHSMTHDRNQPPFELLDRINRDFGNLDAFKDAWVEAGAAHFGSGWLWLLLRHGSLKIAATHDARNFLTRRDVAPLLVCDLWEHAYYLDHQNDRRRYLRAWIDNLANWAYAEEMAHAAHVEGKRHMRHLAEAPYFRAA